MPNDLSTVQVGAATVTVIDVGELQADLGEWFQVSPADRPPRYADFFAQPVRLPIQAVLIRLPQTTILVDAPKYDLSPEESELAIPGYQPPPGLLDRLAELAVDPAAVEHVVITHAHFDHFNGTITQRDGQHVPAFPRARHYLGRADWDDLQAELAEPGSLASRTLGLLRQQGLLDLVSGERDMGHGVQLIPTPGETPGHQVLRLYSAGQTLYCLGDLYHHRIEVERPDWGVHWADADAMRAGREALVAAALAEQAVLVATHIAGAGRLQAIAGGVTWVAV